ncbi:MAG: aldo/keto reductase [Planctomycetota bacterium]
MHYRHLGRAGVQVSEIAYGSWITAGGQYAAEASIACHERAYELGINCFDTADVYNAGQAETIVGRVLKSIPRRSIVLATKCHGRMGEGVNDRGTSRKHVREACEASLARLDVEYIDVYQAHSYDAETPIEETCRAFDDLIRQGKILYWGVSNWGVRQVAEAAAVCARRGYDAPVSHQPRYNLFAREIEADLMPLCKQHGLGFIVYSPLAQGLLTGKYANGTIPAGSRAEKSDNFKDRHLTAYNLAAVQELQSLASECALSVSQLALAWVLRRDELSAAIVGASRPEQLDETVKAAGVKLDEATQQKIEKILNRRRAAVHDEDAAKLRTEK